VLQRDELGTGLKPNRYRDDFQQPGEANHPSRVGIPLASTAGKASGLRLDSWLMTDNLVTVFDSEIDSLLGQMPDVPEMVAVAVALKHTLALP
jgi:hypothetical protein